MTERSDADALHRSLLTLDSHIDIPWPDGDDPFERSAERRVDLVKMREGGVSAGCFAAYIPQGPTDAAGHAEASDRAFAMLNRIREMGAERNGIAARICDSADAIDRARAEGAIAIVPAIENAYAVGEDLSLVARYRALGVRYMTLTHNGHNAVADSAIPRRDLGDGETRWNGLSPFGLELVAELNRHGVLIDVSHLSRDGMLQAAARSATPVVATHSCVRALSDHRRNLDDTQLDALRETGGLIQITAMPGFLRPRGVKPDGRPADVADLVDHIDYVADRIGAAHVGISSDFDGGGAIMGWRDASESPAITAELIRRGYATAEIAALWGGNLLRLLRKAEAISGCHSVPDEDR
ncbi:dipeptidase [Acetobacteraceae bacterium KSS8]|uniref:Dipeptidase n=1 Tax=Endosaccharibacter trunci TaxID=2812733 RepID=A0ABT1W334_9PROT|nr:dipeptidase [Acetobacteraceae bacterium KSS8]